MDYGFWPDHSFLYSQIVYLHMTPPNPKILFFRFVESTLPTYVGLYHKHSHTFNTDVSIFVTLVDDRFSSIIGQNDTHQIK